MNTTTYDVAGLLERVHTSTPLTRHDGRSGAGLERAVLDDGTAVVIKRSRREDDLVMLASDDFAGREAVLWAAGVLDRLPRGVCHPVLAAGWIADELVTVMSDLGARVPRWDNRFTPDQLSQTFASVGQMHRSFADRSLPGLCDLATRLTLFAPERVTRLASHHNPLPRAILRGWECFTDQVDSDVAEAVMATHDNPRRLVEALACAPTTLLHGDLILVNVAPGHDDVTLLDWSLATAGPAVVDFVCFLVSSASRVDQPYDAQVDLVRVACEPWHDENVLHAALFWAMLELGWNLALNAVEYPDPAERAIARRDLAWWTARARHALEEGVVG
jgi:Phosphotransferase enzyme family